MALQVVDLARYPRSMRWPGGRRDQRDQTLWRAFLSYESIREVAGLKHVVHLADTVLEEYQEEAEA
jgi:hypothetical protein